MAKTVKTKVVKAKAKRKKRMSKGARHPWEVWSLDTPWASNKPEKFHTLYEEFKTQNQAKACIKDNPGLIAPVIRHVDIPPMEY